MTAIATGIDVLPRRVTLRVPGAPVPKKRPRVVTKNGKVMTYTPAPTRDYEDTIAARWLSLDPADRVPFVGPVKVLVEVREGGRAADLDNYVKTALDGLNRLAWADDKQVEGIVAWIRRKHADPGLDIEIVESRSRA